MKEALKVLSELVAEGVIDDYAIGGAMGATFYLEPVLTMDLDVFVLFKDNDSFLPLQPIYDALKKRGYLPDERMPDTKARVLPAEYLAAISVQTGRMKDKLRVQAFLTYDKFDKGAFAKICAAHGLVCPVEESEK